MGEGIRQLGLWRRRAADKAVGLAGGEGWEEREKEEGGKAQG